MGLVPLTVEVLLVFVLTAYLINKYARLQNQNVIVTLSTFVGWFFSFVIIFVLPLDVAITFYHKCNARELGNSSACELPGGYVSDDTLMGLWQVTYWSAQILTWIVLPLLQSYVTAGDFSFWGKLKAAVFNNVLYYGLYLFCFIVIMVYAVVKGVDLNFEHMKVIVISASNTFGLFLLVLLLGYGLVEVPRSLWHTGRKRYRLNKTYFDIEKLASDKCEAEENVKELYRKTRAVINLLKNDHINRTKAQQIVSKFPEDVIDRLFPARSAMEFNAHSETNPAQVASENFLINLHWKVIVAVQSHHATCAQWSELINRAIFLENIAQAENLGTRLELQDSWFLPEWAAQLWYVTLRRPVCKLIGLMLSLMTLFILVSECTFFVVSPTLSPAALLMDYAANRFHYKYTQFVAMALIFYLCACAYYTIFRLKIYKYYHLDPRGHTDENSMLFSAILLCRLTPPICLNFLGMIHLDSHVAMLKDGGVETQFTKLMGHLDVIPIIAKGINIYLPFCIIFLCAVHYFRIATYLLHSLGFDQYVEEDEFTKSMINSGKSLVQIEKNSIRRKTEVTARTERYKKHTKKMKNYKPLPDDERPMIGYEEDDEEESEALGSTSIQMTSTPQKSHPTSANFFDDM